MLLRNYDPADCGEILKLFYDTVHTVNVADYTPAQCDVWATGRESGERWDASLRAHRTLVAVKDGKIVGFGDMDQGGYLDRLYVHRDFQGRGIATAICDALEEASSAATFTTHASITARPFFLSRGYRVVKEQTVLRGGLELTNFVMEKPRT